MLKIEMHVDKLEWEKDIGYVNNSNWLIELQC